MGKGSNSASVALLPRNMNCKCENGDIERHVLLVLLKLKIMIYGNMQKIKLSSCFYVCGGRTTCVSGIQCHLNNDAITQNCGALDFFFVANHLPGWVGWRSGTG